MIINHKATNMKKILLGFCMAACTLFATAKDYTDKLVVTVDDFTTPAEEKVVSVDENEDGTITVLLKNFHFSLGGEDLPLGNIVVENIPLTQENGYDSFTLDNRHITVTAGDEEGVLIWYGPSMFPDGLDIDMVGKMSNEKFYCTLDLNFGTQIIHVVFGTDDFPSSVLSAKADDPDKLVNVYTILGTLAKSNVRKADALDGLQRGIYIVDGKKVIKQ